MNEEIIKGKWTEFKGEVLNQWGKLTNDELDKTSGNMVSILGMIQQRYGLKKEEAQEKLSQIASRFSDKSEDLKNKMRNSNTDSKNQ
jgi:uncharacterized protein YjbJ (UPF0337 family)